MEDLQSETDSDYTSYWKDWVSHFLVLAFRALPPIPVVHFPGIAK